MSANPGRPAVDYCALPVRVRPCDMPTISLTRRVGFAVSAIDSAPRSRMRPNKLRPAASAEVTARRSTRNARFPIIEAAVYHRASTSRTSAAVKRPSNCYWNARAKS
jgi:hypothetical protein